MNLTKDKYFIDTNLLVYLFSNHEPLKKATSQEIFKNAHITGKGMISYQVVQEFCNVALKKFEKPLSLEDCKLFINSFLFPICTVYPGNEIFNTALEIKLETNFSFYDSLILASAYIGSCKVVYSEDLNPGQKVRDMVIVNPFSNC
jgi:predicted nucleic acid-binding protein